MRLFIALPIPEDLKARVAGILGPLRKSGADYKWVEPKNLHLTLAFLGETPESRVPDVEAAMAGAVEGRAGFDLAFSELGAFDSWARPRVIWIGVGPGAGPLKDIASALLAALKKSDLLPEKEKDRPFSAHLTLGRMRSPRSLERLKDALKRLPPLDGLAFRAERLVLYESKLSPQGPSYREVLSRDLADE